MTKTEAPATDWYTPALKAADRALVGAHWRCSAHGLVEPTMVGPTAYCPEDGCTEAVRLVQKSRGMCTPDQGVWRKSSDGPATPGRFARRPPRTSPPAREPAADPDGLVDQVADEHEELVHAPQGDHESAGTPKTAEGGRVSREAVGAEDGRQSVAACPAEAVEEEKMVELPVVTQDEIAERLRQAGPQSARELAAHFTPQGGDLSVVRNRIHAAMTKLKARGRIVPGEEASKWAAAETPRPEIGKDLQAAMAPPPAAVETPIAPRRPTSTRILELLRENGGRMDRKAVIAALERERPDVGPREIGHQVDVAAGLLIKRGDVERPARGVLALPPKEVLEELHQDEIHNLRPPPPPVASTSGSRGDGARRLAPIAESYTVPCVTISLTAAMRAKLEELRATGWHGHDLDEVAERVLANALRGIGDVEA